MTPEQGTQLLKKVGEIIRILQFFEEKIKEKERDKVLETDKEPPTF